jgi:hypothetical protein
MPRGTMGTGGHHAEWNGRCSDGSAATTGVYFMRLRTPDGSKTVKAVLLK